MGTESKLNTASFQSPSSFSLQQHREQGQQSLNNSAAPSSSLLQVKRPPAPHGIPTGCNSPSTASTWLCTQGPSLRRCSTQVPIVSSSLTMAPSPHHGLLFTSCSSSTGLLWGISTGCSSFRPHPLLHDGLLHGCMRRSAPCGTHGLQRDSLHHHSPLLG